MNSWKNENSTKLQRLKISDLLKQYGSYRLNHPIEGLTKGQAHYLIDALLSGNLEKLIEKKVLLPVHGETPPESGFIALSKPVKYRVSGGEHFFSYTDFRTAVSGRLLDYKTEGSEILYQIIEVEKEISPEVLKKYSLTIKKIED
ncbi:hypothetical protein ACHAL6_10750 [Proteiniclasticum sp. C24MP]|uniref:hypothetical protein n=1 Tax=Proteiniclasticum sp. C24MP TaxID=3374101 RepID=UPI003754AFF1